MTRPEFLHSHIRVRAAATEYRCEMFVKQKLRQVKTYRVFNRMRINSSISKLRPSQLSKSLIHPNPTCRPESSTLVHCYHFKLSIWILISNKNIITQPLDLESQEGLLKPGLCLIIEKHRIKLFNPAFRE